MWKAVLLVPLWLSIIFSLHASFRADMSLGIYTWSKEDCIEPIYTSYNQAVLGLYT